MKSVESFSPLSFARVSTLAVEWIEINQVIINNPADGGLHPRGGVD